MPVFHGSCHCGAVRFEVETDLAYISRCNCSICTKKGSLNHTVPPERFRLVQGESELVLYQFNTRTASHYFCRHCGVHPFSRPRTAPESYNVNVNCLDDADLEALAPERRTFDGRNWERTVAAQRGT